jgi:hypothetical protein
MPAVPLVVISALAAAIGRYALAHAFRLIREKVPGKMRQNLEAAGKAIEKRKVARCLVWACLRFRPSHRRNYSRPLALLAFGCSGSQRHSSSAD